MGFRGLDFVPTWSHIGVMTKRYEAHLRLDPNIGSELVNLAAKERRSVTAQIEILIIEALAARKSK